SPFHFTRSAGAWRGAGVRSVAINSFADGGTNVHAILESWPAATGDAAVRRQPLQPPALQRIDVRLAAGDTGITSGFWDGDGMTGTHAEAASVQAVEDSFWGL
ncbi:hypothetical protein, partial [Janthinobacterium sp.]|uniref:hypothetical protein n=1 Tax=Janthinobacterium sp. TaxID=1871054 RepID=UPI002DBAE1F6